MFERAQSWVRTIIQRGNSGTQTSLFKVTQPMEDRLLGCTLGHVGFRSWHQMVQSRDVVCAFLEVSGDSHIRKVIASRIHLWMRRKAGATKCVWTKLLNTSGDNWQYSSNSSPGWYGSVNWMPACEPNGRWFNSQAGHMPGLWARSPIGGAWKATTHWCFSPSFSLPPPL